MNDVLTAANGLVIYHIALIKYKKAPVVPWFLWLDHNKQLLEKTRKLMYSGWCTHIDGKRIPMSMGKYKLLLEIERLLKSLSKLLPLILDVTYAYLRLGEVMGK